MCLYLHMSKYLRKVRSYLQFAVNQPFRFQLFKPYNSASNLLYVLFNNLLNRRPNIIVLLQDYVLWFSLFQRLVFC